MTTRSEIFGSTPLTVQGQVGRGVVGSLGTTGGLEGSIDADWGSILGRRLPMLVP